jgi:hypothetical protein
MAITALPTPPSRQDPTNFNDRADSFLGALPQFQTEANALQTNVNTSEVNAVNSAAAVLAATNIVKWVSGTTYDNGAVVWSPINGLGYRRITASGSGTTDPSADTSNYKQVNGTGDVSTSGDQTIAGTKTFTSTIAGSVTGNAGTVTNGVYNTGNQTIAGTKTFTSTIIGTATNATLAAKASTVASGGGDGTAIQLNWSGFGGQPTWIFGGETPGNVNVYNPGNFNVNNANTVNFISPQQVLNATAAAGAGSVGSYAFLRTTFSQTTANVTASYGPGTTHAGSSLRYSGTGTGGTLAPAGTWRALGEAWGVTSDGYNYFYMPGATVFLRIS